MDVNEKSDPPTDDNSNNSDDSYSIPSSCSVLNETLESEEEDLLHFTDVQDETPKKAESSSDVIDCDEWQELIKSDYAKVIFCDLYYEASSGNVGCKFEITDSVHEDPCDYVGLFHIGFENLDECLVYKSLSDTDCEEDGKLLRCNFMCEELPELEMGFYQFLYITRDKDICGASMPFEIKPDRMSLSPDSVMAEKMNDEDFLLVRHGLEKKNQLLEELLAESHEKNRELSSTLASTIKKGLARDVEKEVLLESLQSAIGSLKKELEEENSLKSNFKENLKEINEKYSNLVKEHAIKNSILIEKEKTIKDMCFANESMLKNKTDAIYVLEHKNKCLETENIQFKESIKCLQTQHSNLNFDKSVLQEEMKQLRMQLKSLQEKNAFLEKEVDMLRKSLCNDNQNLISAELLDHKFMVKALEQSKELALKEMSDLSHSLSGAMKELNTVKAELDDCKKALQEKENSEISMDITMYIDGLTKELSDCQESLKISKDSEKNALSKIQDLKEEILQLNAVASTYSSLTIKIIFKCAEVSNHISEMDKEVSKLYHLMADLKPGSQGNTEFRSKKCALLARSGILKDYIQTVKEQVDTLRDYVSDERLNANVKKAQDEQLRIMSEASSKCLSLETQLFDLEEEYKKLVDTLRDYVSPHANVETAQDEQVVSRMSELLHKEKESAKKSQSLEEENHELKSKYATLETQMSSTEACNQKLLQEVSDLAKECSNLKEEKHEINTKYSSLEVEFHDKDTSFLKLKEECQKKDEIIEAFRNEEERTAKEGELQALVNDHVARLSEAAKLYKKQYKQIEKLKKKLTKTKKQNQYPSSLSTDTTASVTSNLSEVPEATLPVTLAPPMTIENIQSEGTPPVEMFLSRRTSDSDTGEHMSEGNTSKQSERIFLKPKTSKQKTTDRRGELFKAQLTKPKKRESIGDKLYERIESPNTQELKAVKRQVEVPCLQSLSFKSLTCKVPTSDHEKGESICPYCGITFKKYMPKVFLANHIMVLHPEKFSSEMGSSAIAESISNLPEQLFYNKYTDGGTATEKMCSVSCPMCKEVVYVSCKTTKALDQHLEQHNLIMCTCCGMLFDECVPEDFLKSHMQGHFKISFR